MVVQKNLLINKTREKKTIKNLFDLKTKHLFGLTFLDIDICI